MLHCEARAFLWNARYNITECLAFASRLDQGIVDGDYELVPYQGGAGAEGSLKVVHVDPAEASASDPNPALEGKHRSMNHVLTLQLSFYYAWLCITFQAFNENLVAYP